MQTRTKHIFLNAATTASSSGTYPCDYRFDSGGLQRNLYGYLTSGAEINIYTNFYDPDTKTLLFSHLEDTVSAGSSSYTTATNSFATVVNGPVEAIRIEKVGASGTATVVGIL